MLAELDTIGWDDLTHAYGRAGDVPDQIRALRSPDPDVRDKALSSLYGNIFHQGTRFEASAHAVPFLLELLADPGTPDRPAILRLLTHLAVGYHERHLPAGYPIAGHRADAAGGEALLAAGKAYEDEDEDDEDGDWDDGAGGEDIWGEEVGLFQYVQSLGHADGERLFAYLALRAYDAAGAGLPLLRDLLTAPDPRLRTAAAFALAWFPEEREGSLPPLLRAAADEQAAVAATALAAIGLITPAGPAPQAMAVLDAALDDPRDVVRWGAAVARANVLGPAAGDRAAAELAGWAGRAGGADEEIPFLDGDLPGYAAQALIGLGEAHSGTAFEALLARLPAVSGREALAVADAALRIVFPEPLPPGTPFAALDDRGRRLAGVLAASPGTWRLGEEEYFNFSELVTAHGLPRSHERMAAYVSGQAPAPEEDD